MFSPGFATNNSAFLLIFFQGEKGLPGSNGGPGPNGPIGDPGRTGKSGKRGPSGGMVYHCIFHNYS